jgi:peptidoglycan-N-acetylglucosamine deacetylase
VAEGAHPQIAITIDDLPVHAPYPPGVTPLAVNRQMIAALKLAHVPVTAFVNAVNVKDAETRRALREWRSAGFVLGNHGWSHQHLSEMTIPQFEQELTKDEPILSTLGGRTDWHWFRYPFLDEGKDQAQRIAGRAVLAKHGYRVADVTTGFSDWAWTPAYARCTAKRDRRGLAQLERLYLAAVKRSIADDRATARLLYGRDIPYVLLMHVSAMSAHMMPQVLSTYRLAGYRFISLAQAERDHVYRAYTNLGLPPPPSRGEAAGLSHVKLPPPADYSAALDAICA